MSYCLGFAAVTMTVTVKRFKFLAFDLFVRKTITNWTNDRNNGERCFRAAPGFARSTKYFKMYKLPCTTSLLSLVLYEREQVAA